MVTLLYAMKHQGKSLGLAPFAAAAVFPWPVLLNWFKRIKSTG